MSDEELYQLTGSWEAAAALRDEQNIAANEWDWANPVATTPAVAATPATPAAVEETATVEEPTTPTLTYSSTDEQGNPIYEPVATPATPTTPAAVTTPAATTSTFLDDIINPPTTQEELITAISPPVAPTTPVTPVTPTTPAAPTTPTVPEVITPTTPAAPAAPTAPAKPSSADIVKVLTANSTADDSSLVKLLEDIGATPADIAKATGSKVADIEKRFNDAAVKNWPTIIPGSTDEDGRPVTTTTTSDGTPFYLRDEDGGGMYQNPATVETYAPYTGEDGKTYYKIHAPTFSSGKEATETPVTGYLTEAQYKALRGGSTLGDAVKSIVNSPVGSFALGVLGPTGQAINAVNQASQGNVLGAITTGLGAAQGFGVTDLGGFAIKDIQNVARGLNAIDKKDLMGALTAGANLVGGVPGDYKTVTNLASATLALKNSDTAGFLSAMGDLTGSADAKTAAAATRLLAAVNADNPNIANIQAAATALNSAVSGTGSTTGSTTSTAGTTTVGDFEDTEVTRLKGLGYTKEQIQEYFRNLDNLTEVLDTDTGTVTGGTGIDTVTGGTGTDTVTSGTGTDTVTSGGGTDDLETVTVTGGTGTDTVTGVDTVTSGGGTNTVTGGTGNDDTVTVVGDRPCAPGFHKNDIGLCVSDDDKPPLECTEGYEPNEAGTECIPIVETVTVVDKKCDPGFVYDEDLKMCVPIKATECAPGFHDDGTGLCVSDDDKKPLDCPEGYEPNEAGTECIPKIEIVDKKCDPGYVYDEDLKQCVPIETVTVVDKNCPPGQVYDEDLKQCVPIADDSCPTGFHKDESGKCVPDTKETLSCPEGYELNEAGTECIPVVKIVDKKCPPGQVYDEDLKQCVPIKTEECAPGFHKDETGLCVPDDEECKTGYEKVDGTCVPVCKEGYIRNLATGVCEKAEKDCPPGQVKNAEGKCVPIVKTPPPPPPPPPPPKKCPPGYVLVDGTCVLIPTFTPGTGSYTSEDKTDPIYAGGMEDFDLFATLEELLADKSDKTDKKKDNKKSKDKTKMATGGHLDDLLAEQMTVDDLLKLLR
jgi:Ca2+-binding RTX toxin-like protein